MGKRKRGVVWLSRRSTLSMIFLGLGLTLLVGALTLSGIPVGWMVWYRLNPETSGKLAEVLGQKVEPVTAYAAKPVSFYEPPIDPKLPMEKRILVPSMGVSTLIHEAPLTDYEGALKKGVWRVPDFGDPQTREKPMILAAHRFGYLAWSVPYRLANSFYNLPKLKVGDKITVNWLQRPYVYEVYALGEGKEIGDYSADLILYTCKFLESPVRLFAYARLIEAK